MTRLPEDRDAAAQGHALCGPQSTAQRRAQISAARLPRLRMINPKRVFVPELAAHAVDTLLFPNICTIARPSGRSFGRFGEKEAHLGERTETISPGRLVRRALDEKFGEKHKRPGKFRRPKSTHSTPFLPLRRAQIMSGPLMIDLFHKFVITAMALSFLLAGNIISFTELTGVLSFRLLMIFPVIAIVSDTIGLFAASLTVVPGTALILYGVLSAGLSAGWLVGLVKASNQAHSFNLRADMDNTCACGAQLMNSVVGWMGASFALHVVSVMTSLWRAYHKEALRWRQPAGDTDQQQLDNL